MWNKLPNGAIDRQVRAHLKQLGYRKREFELQQIELVAIERPGWKQIFRFSLQIHAADGTDSEKIGIVYDDHRSHCEIRLVDTEDDYETVLADWGEGMILRRISQHEFNPLVTLIAGTVLVVGALTIIALAQALQS